jgi:hypothetical protein
MQEPREARSIIEAAEQSAAGGDYASAERLLREAADLQEASLGPLDPDLANTLNNLGVVCEMNNNPVQAEHCFRRAFAIATTVLTPDHPFVATSRQNLRDFCDARGIPIELPPSTSVEPPATSVEPSGTSVEPPPTSVDPPHEESPPHAESEDVQPPMRRRFIGPVAIGALGPVAMLIVILAAVRPWFNSTGEAQSPPAIVTDAPREAVTDAPREAVTATPREAVTDAPREAPARPQPPSPPVEPATLREETPRSSAAVADEGSARRIVEASTPARLTVVKARLCAELDDFACDPPDSPVPAGPLFFYTQVKSTSATSIEHRWYRDNRLYQSIQLRIQASPNVGYRTFSRSIMTSESTGNWRVELRTEGGVLLHEERFSVH